MIILCFYEAGPLSWLINDIQAGVFIRQGSWCGVSFYETYKSFYMKHLPNICVLLKCDPF